MDCETVMRELEALGKEHTKKISIQWCTLDLQGVLS